MREEMEKLKWETYGEIRQGFLLMMEPLRAKFKRAGHIKLGSHGALYDEETSEMEAFSRITWGIGSFLTQNDDDDFLSEFLSGLTEGVNPVSLNYWGDLTDYHQKFVEMTSLALALLLNPVKVWQKFSEIEQKQIGSWLYQINDHKIPNNNWRFFRILVNVALQKLRQDYSQEQINADFAQIDSCYVGKGWYFDGKESQRDYYIPWGYHYYGLIVSQFIEDKSRASLLKQRATKFAQIYRYYFAENGAAIPFGRSLTYRFAQSAFWSALVFANCEALPWGEIKGLFARNMQWWMRQEIFDNTGILTVGYAYTNLNMAEGYNAPGSPYWAFKSFLLLAVPRDHPYWTAPAAQPDSAEQKIVCPESRGIIETVEHQVLYYPAGQFVENQNHTAAKYGKFVYSTVGGFSVPKSNGTYAQGAFDNTLVVSEDNETFFAKGRDDGFEILKDQISHIYQPMKGVRIKTVIIPRGNSHLRIHEIETEREIYVYDGGFCVNLSELTEEKYDDKSACLRTRMRESSIFSLTGYEKAAIVHPEPNTNLLYPRTAFPYLKSLLSVGKYRLVSMIKIDFLGNST
jgi:hypothetical protein